MPTVKITAKPTKIEKFVFQLDGDMIKPDQKSQEVKIDRLYKGSEVHEFNLWVWGESQGTLEVTISDKSGDVVHYSNKKKPLKIPKRRFRTRDEIRFALVEPKK